MEMDVIQNIEVEGLKEPARSRSKPPVEQTSAGDDASADAR